MNVHATPAETGARPRLLMCPPRHFAVTYSINPWMDPRSWAGDGHLHAEAERQWTALHDALITAGAVVETIKPAAGLPIWCSQPTPPWFSTAKPCCRGSAT